MYSVKIILDSVNTSGNRLTTYVCEYPRYVHSENMAHRSTSKNSASSRAIPAKTLRERIVADPVIPKYFGKNKKGMQATEEVDDIDAAKTWWLEGLQLMAAHHERGEKLGLHKQLLNRVIEAWMFIPVVLSATELENFFFLRYHGDAQPEMAWMAEEMYCARERSKPTLLQPGEWHLPFIRPEDREETGNDVSYLKKISVARCARVSYLTHMGIRDFREDIRLHDELSAIGKPPTEPLHMSPFEHVAEALDRSERIGNMVGFKQYRKEFEREAGPVKFLPPATLK